MCPNSINVPLSLHLHFHKQGYFVLSLQAICGTDAYKHPLWNTELTHKLIEFIVGGFAQLDVPIMDPEKFKKASGILDSPVFLAKLDDRFKVWGRKDAAEMDMVRLMLWELKG